jgi:lipoprotein-releasing system ATP-binding protein
MIQATALHKYYDNLHVLKGVDLHIQKGEIVSLAYEYFSKLYISGS